MLAGASEGTLFVAREQRYSSFKLWLRYAKPSRGTIVVDAGAARALREGGTSLLPVGVVEVRGEFDEGDAVDVVARGGGRAGCEASGRRAARRRRAGWRRRGAWSDRAAGRQGDLQLLGGRSARRRRAPFRGRARAAAARDGEAVHRDYFVLA